jgi:hypothetical protein
MQKAQLGDRVRVQYLRLPKHFNASAKPRVPKELEFTVGSNEIIPKVSLGVVGMAPGDRKKFTLSARETNGLVPAGLAWPKLRQTACKQSTSGEGRQQSTDKSQTEHTDHVTAVDPNSSTSFSTRCHSLDDAMIELEVVVLTIDSSAHANKNRPQFDLGGEA